jgi:hypothetical protein
MIWETVPAGTPRANCRHPNCRAPIYWIERPRMRMGKPIGGVARVPVDCDVEGGALPDSMNPGRGVNHFTTCEAADEF